MAADWSHRHASTQHIMRFFSYDHLPAGTPREISATCAGFAATLVDWLPDGPELSAGMRKLLEAKDCFVRAALPAVPADGDPAFVLRDDPRPHSRACGIRWHPHGSQCSRDCPTCGQDGSAPDETRGY